MVAAYSTHQPEVFAGLMTDDVYVLPASVAQQRFWLLDQLDPGNTSLNMPLALRLDGQLDVGALEQTLNEIVRRHEVLRTTFAREEGQPVQVVTTARSLRVDVVDLSELTKAQRDEEANRLVNEEAHVKFDLAQGSLFIAKLLRLEADQHILLLTLHHIICDGWSNGVLVREIGKIYDALSQGQLSPLSDLPFQYADFALWQQEWLNSESFADQLAYWKQQLGRVLPALDLPTDFARNGNRTSFGAIESLLLSQTLTRALKALSQREDVTPFMTFLAAFKILLHCYSGKDNILLGSPAANRIQSETEELIGAFANTLLLKTDLSGNPSFRETLRRVKDVSLGAFGNQSLPFEKLVEEIKPAESRQSRQLFQVLFIFQTAFMQPVELSDLTITPMRSVSPGSVFDLSLGVVERNEGTRLQLEYNTDLFKAETVKRMLGHLQQILQLFATDIQQEISEIRLLIQNDRDLIASSGTNSNSSAEKNNLREFVETITPAVPPRSPDTNTIVDEQSNGRNGDIERILKEIWQEVLHLETVSIHDDFFEIGGHSLLAANLFDQIARRLQVNLPLATLFNSSTIDQLAKIIRDEQPKEEWSSLVPINTNGTKPPLFLIHAAGGNVLFYKDLANRLGPDQPCYGLQASGLDGRRNVHNRIEDMAAHYINEIMSVQPKGPYHVGGSSFGGLVAYELASQLCERGERVALVALFDTYAPGYPQPLPNRSALKIKASRLADTIEHHFDTLRILKPGERWSYVVAKNRKARNLLRRAMRNVKKRMARGVLRGLGRPLPEALLETQNAIVIASRSYSPRSYQGVVTLFRATKQERGFYRDDTLGWREIAKGGLTVHEVPGTHGSIVVEPRVSLVVEKLAGYIGNQNLSFD